MINQACKLPSCLALKKEREFREVPVPPELLEGGKNPHSVKCKEVMKGQVVIGLNENKHQQSFCLFEDGSYLR